MRSTNHYNKNWKIVEAYIYCFLSEFIAVYYDNDDVLYIYLQLN